MELDLACEAVDELSDSSDNKPTFVLTEYKLSFVHPHHFEALVHLVTARPMSSSQLISLSLLGIHSEW